MLCDAVVIRYGIQVGFFYILELTHNKMIPFVVSPSIPQESLVELIMKAQCKQFFNHFMAVL